MKHANFFFLGAIILLMVATTQSANILFLGLPIFSHFKPMTFLAKELHKRGHNSFFPVTQKLTKSLKISEGTKFLHMKDNPAVEEFSTLALRVFSPQKNATWNEVLKAMQKACDNLLLDDDWFHSLKAVNATLAIVDGIFMSTCLAIIPYKLSIPFVFCGAQNSPDIHRTPWVFSAFPFKMTTYSDKMSFMERLHNSFLISMSYLLPPMGAPSKSVKAYAPNKPEISFDDLLRKAELHIIDSDVLMDYALPSLPNVEYIGGLGAQPAEPLEGDLLKFVNSAKNGIIVVSFGSVVSSLPKEHLEKMGEAFKQIKYDIVWKWSDTSYSSSNVFLTKWMPQNDLLGHPQTKLFITHCGNGGQFESLYHGVPMLGFPVFADQPHNCRRMVYKGYGLSMDLYNYAVEELVSNIKEVIENTKYKNNIQRASDIFKSRPEHPSERGARIVDDVIKYGGGFLRSYCQDMPFYQYFMLDILAVVLSSAIVGILIVVFILRKCFSFCCRKKEKHE